MHFNIIFSCFCYSKKTAVETCPLTDEQQLYKTMMNDLSKRSRRNSIKPPFNPNPSLPECSTNVEEQNSLILYVQTNSESSTILLMEPWACKMEAIHTLVWGHFIICIYCTLLITN